MGTDDQPRLIRVDTAEREEHAIPEGTTRIGRSRGLDICLEDSAVSRFHCYLVRQGDEVRVFNGESKNPARVDGEEANGQLLRSGHTLRIGRCELVYCSPLEPAPPASASERPPARRRLLGSRAGGQRRRSLAQPAALLLAALLIVPALSILFGLVGRKDSGPTREPEAALRVERLEREIAELKAERERKLGAKDASGEDADKVRQLTARLAELHAELEAEQERDRASRSAASPASAPGSAAPGEGLPFPELESAPEMAAPAGPERQDPEKHSAASSRTVVVPPRPAAVKRSRKEVSGLVAGLCSKIDDYATHTVFPRSLEPDLTDLSTSLGKEGAEALLQVYEHARTLLRQTDASIEANERRRQALLKKAEQGAPAGTPTEGSGSRKDGSDPMTAGGKKDGSDSKSTGGKKVGPGPKAPGAYGKAASVQAENDQRLLEAFAKAAQIHAKHREFLVALRDAVLASVKRLTDSEALAYLRSRFADEADVDLSRAILPAFEAAAHRECVPVLYRRLGITKDAGLRAAIQRTLASVTGVDLGERASAWADWWSKNGR